MSELSLFDYAGMSADTATEVRAAAERIRVRMKRTAEDIIAIGLDLVAVKERLPHGAFLPWIEAEFGMSESAAGRFMKVATVYGGKSVNLTNLTPSVLYELAAPSTPEPVRQIVEQKAAANESVSVEEVKRLKRELAEARLMTEQATSHASAVKSDADRYRKQAETLLDNQSDLIAKAKADARQQADQELAEARASADVTRKALETENARLTHLTAEVREAALNDARGKAEALAEEELSKRKESLEKAQTELDKVKADIDRRKSALMSIESSIEEKKSLADRLTSVDYEAREILKDADELIRLQALFMVVIDDIGFADQHPEKVRNTVGKLADQCGKLQSVLSSLYARQSRAVEIELKAVAG